MAKGKYQAWLEPEALERIANWAANGLTDTEIARNMGVHRNTLAKWVATHECICGAIKRGRLMSCEAVENALFAKATGNVSTEETVTEARSELRNGEMVEVASTRRTVTRTQPPDTAAAIFYLKNRMPDRYSDRRTMEVEATMPTVVLGVDPRRADG